MFLIMLAWACGLRDFWWEAIFFVFVFLSSGIKVWGEIGRVDNCGGV